MYYYSDEDIYQVSIPLAYRQLINITLLGTVTAGPDQKPIKGTIVVRNIKTGESYVTQSNEHDGRYSIVMAAGQSYEVIFSSSRYHAMKVSFDYTKEEKYREERKDINLSSSWPLILAVQDKTLKHPIKTKVSLTRDDKQVILSDTVDVSAVPKTIQLESDQRYMLSVSASDYMAFSQELKFIPQTFREGEPYIVALEHETVPVKADVTEGIGGTKKRVKVTYSNENTGEVIVADAGDVVNLRKGDRYQVMTSSDKGFSYAMESIVAGETGSDVIALSVLALKQGTKLTLNHINFQSNSAELNEASTTELQQIVKLLKDNPGVVIEISAHTDDVGSDAYNDNLSQKRAQSVTQFLAKNNTPLSQLVTVGYGKKQPIVPNDSDENRAKNRRVELLVLKGE
jgi:outer membrane protein OmpA-like peptidoglycan-associated protein